MEIEKYLVVSGSPHFHTSDTTTGAMWRVVVALLPALAAGFWWFGLPAFVVTAATLGGCLATEYLVNRFMLHRPFSLSNGSAVITGLLLAMSLPPALPWWIALIGGVVAIGVGKMPFGGLGCNIFNPAMVGRVFLLLSFPVQLTTWTLPDGSTGATPLALMKLGELAPSDLDMLGALTGNMGGSFGEVCALALILGFVYLLATKTVSWHASLAVLGSLALMDLAFGGNVGAELLTGGVLLGAFFMATDYVTSPTSHTGMVVFGIGIGVITYIIRHWGAYPEGLSFAILLMNGLVPLINRFCKPRKFGERRNVI